MTHSSPILVYGLYFRGSQFFSVCLPDDYWHEMLLVGPPRWGTWSLPVSFWVRPCHLQGWSQSSQAYIRLPCSFGYSILYSYWPFGLRGWVSSYLLTSNDQVWCRGWYSNWPWRETWRGGTRMENLRQVRSCALIWREERRDSCLQQLKKTRGKRCELWRVSYWSLMAIVIHNLSSSK